VSFCSRKVFELFLPCDPSVLSECAFGGRPDSEFMSRLSFSLHELFQLEAVFFALLSSDVDAHLLLTSHGTSGYSVCTPMTEKLTIKILGIFRIRRDEVKGALRL